MERKIFKTFFKKDHKHGDNEYVKGRVMGIMLGLSNAIDKTDDVDVEPIYSDQYGSIFIHKCSQEVYDIFTKVVEDHYPGLCVFNYNE